MYSFPDLAPLFWLALFGLVCAASILVFGLSWLGYHLVMAFAAYFGAAA